MSPSEKVKQEVQQLVQALPNLLWIRIMSVDGLKHHAGSYDADRIGYEALYEEEDKRGPMTAASLSLSERITDVLGLGESQFSVIAGNQGIHFLLPIGDGTKWVMSLGFKGQPAIDPIIRYFRDHDYLASLVPLLGR